MCRSERSRSAIAFVVGIAVAAMMPAKGAAQHASPSSAKIEEQATTAYESKQYQRCAELWMRSAAGRPHGTSSDAHYNAACCHALNGQVDLAFASLEHALGAGFRDQAHLMGDSDLASLRGDPRWRQFTASLDERIAAWEKTLGDPVLRREILAMVREDQRLRFAAIQNKFQEKELAAQIEAVDRRNTQRMKAIVDARGWPGRSLVGKDGAHAAWLLVQHADLDLPFQKRCLAAMEPQIHRGEVEPMNYAYLVDRIAVAEKRKQVYGTQFGENRQPRPIEDEAHVDERRKAVGLETLTEYKAQMLRLYGPPPSQESGSRQE